MNLLSVSKAEKKAVLEIASDELVALCNVLYHETKRDDARAIVYQIYDDLIFAKDLSQYGHIDSFSLERIIECRKKIIELGD